MKTIATLLTAVALLSAASHAAEKPNVVLILIDDFGYECVTADGVRKLSHAGDGQARRDRRAL